MAPRASIPCILLTQKAEIKAVKIPYEANILTLETIQAHLKKSTPPEILGTYRYKTFLLSLIGYTKGKAGSENKHELPPPLDSNLFFGDILLVASTSPNNYQKPVAFKPDEYEAFYTKSFGGFDDLDSDSEEEEDEEEEAEAEGEGEEEKKEKTVVEEDGSDSESTEESDTESVEEEEVGLAEFEAECEVEEPQVRRAKVSKKRPAPSLLVSQTGSSQILHVPKSDHLTTETTSTAANYPQRLRMMKQLASLLKENGVDDIHTEEFERCVYNSTVRDAMKRNVTCHWNNSLFRHIYETKTRQIVGNLIPSSYIQNTKLLDEFRSGKYTIEQVCDLDTYALSTDMWRDFIHRRVQREKRQLEGNKAMATDQFLCTRCHKRECTYYEMQTRSADEPMTIFITCINCQKHWRQ
jgi:DNA-directed RNA polymerase subunit M/transcription elongation factor TFIIS